MPIVFTALSNIKMRRSSCHSWPQWKLDFTMQSSCTPKTPVQGAMETESQVWMSLASKALSEPEQQRGVVPQQSRCIKWSQTVK